MAKKKKKKKVISASIQPSKVNGINDSSNNNYNLFFTLFTTLLFCQVSLA